MWRLLLLVKAKPVLVGAISKRHAFRIYGLGDSHCISPPLSRKVASVGQGGDRGVGLGLIKALRGR